MKTMVSNKLQKNLLKILPAKRMPKNEATKSVETATLFILIINNNVTVINNMLEIIKQTIS